MTAGNKLLQNDSVIDENSPKAYREALFVVLELPHGINKPNTLHRGEIQVEQNKLRTLWRSDNKVSLFIT